MSPRPDPPAHRTPHEPLSPEERAWALRLAQVGPHAGAQGGPPSALDRRILAAAHAAAAGPRRPALHRRWPALLGAAASLVIVVGLAWQLQPLLRSRPPISEAPTAAVALPASDGALSADVLAAADPVARQAVSRPPAPAVPAVTRTPRKYSAPPAIADRASPPRPSPARATDFGDDAIPPYSDYAGRAAAKQAGLRETTRAAATRVDAPVQHERAAVAASPTPFPAERAMAGRTDAADASEMSSAPSAVSAPAPAQAQAQARMAAPAAGSLRPAAQSPAREAQSEPTNTSLDRIQVTGSRLAMSDLPVRDDAALEPAAWLQRIRDRRDGDDLAGARESLALFRHQHPRLRLPDDLARLGR